MIDQRWSIAQEAPGEPEYTSWALIDHDHRGVRGRLLGETFAQEIADALNGVEQPEPLPEQGQPERALTVVREQADQVSLLDVFAALAETMEISVERDCGHDETGDGSPVTSCPVCMCWAQGTEDAKTLRATIEEVRKIL